MTNMSEEKKENEEVVEKAIETEVTTEDTSAEEVKEVVASTEEAPKDDTASVEKVEAAPEVKVEDSVKDELKEESEAEAQAAAEQAAKKWVAQPKKDRNNRDNDSGFIEKVISINRITKVTKGGKKLSFSALVVVGDTKGNVGYSLSKAAEVPSAIRKAMGVAKKNMIKVPMNGSTITHEIIGQCGGSRVLLKPASEGTGVIASGPVRAVCDGAGIHNILTKCHRSNNPINVVKAAIDGLSRLKVVE